MLDLAVVMFVVLNLACAVLELMQVPNFRPVFRLYSWRGALLGAVICTVAMFAISPINAGVTVVGDEPCTFSNHLLCEF